MRLHRTEKSFMIYLVLLLGAAVCAFWANDVVFAGFDSQSVPDEIATGLIALRVELGLLCSAILVGTFHFYPLLRRQTLEHGEWREKYETLNQKSQTFQKAALTDPMTGLQNRRYFDDALAQYMEEFSRIERPLGIMLLDIDHFKSINDTHGHDVGGEEFAVVAPNVGIAELEKMANRLRLAVSNLVFNLGDTVRLKITISVGIAIWDGEETGAKLYKRADGNLYNAKRGGRNKVCA